MMLRRSFFGRSVIHRSVGFYCTKVDDYIPMGGEKMLPKEIFQQLNRFVIGQEEAKKGVANALHNRWRREQLRDELKAEITPKNILMVGPSGVGKTEIARRLAKLVNAPFIKVEATKYTEVGYHGSDVDSIIKDLVKAAIAQRKKFFREKIGGSVIDEIEQGLLAALVGELPERLHNRYLNMLREGIFDSIEVRIPSSDEEEQQPIQGFKLHIEKPNRPEDIKWDYVTVGEAREYLEDMHIQQLSDKQEDDIAKEAINDVQERGIVFIDEIDKICAPKFKNSSRGDASDEGVQRDLLPLIEGSIISTDHGDVDTSKILFITAGAFYQVKPQDIIPELQGRLPIRLSLNQLTEQDFVDILTKTENNLIQQQIALMKTEDIELKFPEESIREVARIATELNRSVENIGARRLFGIIEKVMEETSYLCPSGTTVEITPEMLRECTKPMLEKADLSRYLI